MRHFSAVVLALWLLLIGTTNVCAKSSTPRGFVVINPANNLNVAIQPGNDAITIPLDDWSSVTPTNIKPYLGNPVWHVYLRTPGDQSGYDYNTVRRLFESPRADGISWASFVLAHPEIEWVLQIGNEPTVDFNEPAYSQRWWMLAIYKELALNSLNHVDKAWRLKYPDLRWSAAIGTTYLAALQHLQWMGGSDLGSGGIRDYYDYISVHLYGESSLDDDSARGDFLPVLSYLIHDRYTRGILITEIGINTSSMSLAAKADAYRVWVNNCDAKIKGVTVFIAGSFLTTWPQYSFDDPSYGQVVGNHW